MAEYGINAAPDSTADDKIAPTVEMSVTEAITFMYDRMNQVGGQGNGPGDVIQVPGPVSVAPYEPGAINVPWLNGASAIAMNEDQDESTGAGTGA